jgi:hypothetical protein
LSVALKRVQPPGGVACQPTTDRVAVNSQQSCHLLTVLGLPGSQEGEHLHTGLPMASMFTWQSLLEGSFIRTNGRYVMAQGHPPGLHAS